MCVCECVRVCVCGGSVCVYIGRDGGWESGGSFIEL